jgi:phosphatidate cytidylyltransferase
MNVSSNLNKRIVTAVIGVSLLLLMIIFGGRIGISLVAAVLALGMAHEFIEMTLRLPDKPEKRMVVLGTVWLIAFLNFWIPRSEYMLFLAMFLGFFSYFLFSAERHNGEELTTHFKELMYCVFGVVYTGFLPLYLPLLRENVGGVHWVIVFLLIVWSNDTGAYFAGLKFGKKKLYPHISPKKTLEGAAGGLILSVAVCLIYKLAAFRGLPWLGVLFVPPLVGVASQVGDLCESFLKRAFNVKDSGTILPGHGGFLDRFDGMVISLPVMYAAMKVFGH